MTKADSSINARTAPDQVLLDIVDYVLDYKVADERSFDTARLCVTDSLACAFDALDIPGCVNLLGPLVPGTVVPNGARVPGTRYELDPVTAAFTTGQRTTDQGEQQHPGILLAAGFAWVRDSAQCLHQRAILRLVHLVSSFKVWQLEGMIRNGR